MTPTTSPPTPTCGPMPRAVSPRRSALGARSFPALLVALALHTGCAGMRDGHGNAWAHHELTVTHDVDPPSATAGDSPRPHSALRFSELVLAGSRVNALLGGRRLGYHIGADLGFGSTLRGAGFAYEIALFPVGAGLRLGAASAVMLGAGVGVSGAVGTLDDAVTLPIELVGEFDAGPARLLARGRISYLSGTPGRTRGARTTSFADETEAMLGLRIGRNEDSYGFPSGNGYFAGIAYRELLGARFLGVTIGYSLDIATRRTHRSD